jgi:hypothetical protein
MKAIGNIKKEQGRAQVQNLFHLCNHGHIILELPQHCDIHLIERIQSIKEKGSTQKRVQQLHLS